MSIQNLSPQKANETLCYNRDLQTAKTPVEIGLVLGIIFTIGTVIAAYMLHGTLFPCAFDAALASAVTLGIATSMLGITHRVLISSSKEAQAKLKDFFLKLEPTELTALAKFPALVLSNLMYFSSDQIETLMNENGEAITAAADLQIVEIEKKQSRGPTQVLQEMVNAFGKMDRNGMNEMRKEQEASLEEGLGNMKQFSKVELLESDQEDFIESDFEQLSHITISAFTKPYSTPLDSFPLDQSTLYIHKLSKVTLKAEALKAAACSTSPLLSDGPNTFGLYNHTYK